MKKNDFWKKGTVKTNRILKNSGYHEDETSFMIFGEEFVDCIPIFLNIITKYLKTGDYLPADCNVISEFHEFYIHLRSKSATIPSTVGQGYFITACRFFSIDRYRKRTKEEKRFCWLAEKFQNGIPEDSLVDHDFISPETQKQLKAEYKELWLDVTKDIASFFKLNTPIKDRADRRFVRLEKIRTLIDKSELSIEDIKKELFKEFPYLEDIFNDEDEDWYNFIARR